MCHISPTLLIPILPRPHLGRTNKKDPLTFIIIDCLRAFPPFIFIGTLLTFLILYSASLCFHANILQFIIFILFLQSSISSISLFLSFYFVSKLLYSTFISFAILNIFSPHFSFTICSPCLSSLFKLFIQYNSTSYVSQKNLS